MLLGVSTLHEPGGNSHCIDDTLFHALRFRHESRSADLGQQIVPRCRIHAARSFTLHNPGRADNPFHVANHEIAPLEPRIGKLRKLKRLYFANLADTNHLPRFH